MRRIWAVALVITAMAAVPALAVVEVGGDIWSQPMQRMPDPIPYGSLVIGASAWTGTEWKVIDTMGIGGLLESWLRHREPRIPRAGVDRESGTGRNRGQGVESVSAVCLSTGDFDLRISGYEGRLSAMLLRMVPLFAE